MVMLFSGIGGLTNAIGGPRNSLVTAVKHEAGNLFNGHTGG